MRTLTKPILLGLAAALSASGCATYSLEPIASRGFAQLSIVLGDGRPVESNYDGLWAVGGWQFATPVKSVVWVRPGKRSIAFVCPGIIFVDGPPTIDRVFEPNLRYELVCVDGKGSIRKTAV